MGFCGTDSDSAAGFFTCNLYINIVCLWIRSRIWIWIWIGLDYLSQPPDFSPIFGIISVSVSFVSDCFVF